MHYPTISILGCGWLGLPLAEAFVKNGHTVKGSTTSESKFSLFQQKGIIPFLIKLSPSLVAESIDAFFNSELLIIAIPPGTRTKPSDFHIQQIKAVLPFISNSTIKKIIYISSTAVYPMNNGEAFEADVTEPSQAVNKTLVTVENLIQAIPTIPSTILRCGGLTGYDRLLIRHFAGKENLTIGEDPVNFIHRDDVVQIILEVVKQEKWDTTYNLCSPLHPLKKDFYLDLATRFDFKAPTFKKPESHSFKIINGSKLISDLDYSFIYPDPMKYRYE